MALCYLYDDKGRMKKDKPIKPISPIKLGQSGDGQTLFKQYLEDNNITRLTAAYELGVGMSSLHYWLHSTTPRGQEIRQRIEEWSNGCVPSNVVW